MTTRIIVTKFVAILPNMATKRWKITFVAILSVYRDPQGWDIVATLSVAMISQSCELRYHSLAQQNFCDIAQYCKKGVIFGRFLQYWQYRKNLCCANDRYMLTYSERYLRQGRKSCWSLFAATGLVLTGQFLSVDPRLLTILDDQISQINKKNDKKRFGRGKFGLKLKMF